MVNRPMPAELSPTKAVLSAPRSRGACPRRRGISTLWTILVIPVLVILLAIVVEIVHLWVGRVELENALEAAALAAVKEWGDAGGGSTLIPRQIGAEYAAANTIFGVPVPIDLNYNPASGNVNENASCTGNLLFGAITNESRPWIFDAGVQPSCGPGKVLFDATSQGNVQGGNDNDWGIAFLADENTPNFPNLRIVEAVIDLTGTPLTFDVASLVLADTRPPFKVSLTKGNKTLCQQPDIFGLDRNDISYSFDASGKILTFQFLDVAVRGFEPCDRFRFGVTVLEDNHQASGDDIGFYQVKVRVLFNTGGTATGVFFDNTDRKNDCECFGVDPFCPNSIIISPPGGHMLPNLPPPSTSAPDNNGQSYAVVGGGAGRPFAVRAQASATVPGLICRFCGINFGPFQVHVETTARYNCETRRPELVRVRCENVICDIPVPPTP